MQKIKELKVENENYACSVIKVNNLISLRDKGLDNLVALPMFGYQALVSPNTVKQGDLVLLFTAETQLSEDYSKNNNLYMDSTLNLDPLAKGYFSSNRRVKAIKLKGNISSAFISPLSSLSYLDIDVSSLKEGDSFQFINGIEICKKYIVKNQVKTSIKEGKGNNQNKRNIKYVDVKVFPEHFSTTNYFKNLNLLHDNDFVTVTQKLHGTSARYGHVKANRVYNTLESIAYRFLPKKVKLHEYEHKYVIGSRTVIKNNIMTVG